MEAGTKQEKQALREAIKRRAAELTETYKSSASAEIVSRVLQFPWFQQAETVFVYVSTAKEPDTRELIVAALAMGKRVLVPRCLSAGQMEAVQIRDFGEMHPGCYGILEPPEGPAVDGTQIDLAVIPCISADRKGGRLGHGAGYYDRYLQGLPCRRLALCFGALLAEEIPMEATDVRMERVATEQQIYNCRLEQASGSERRRDWRIGTWIKRWTKK